MDHILDYGRRPRQRRRVALVGGVAAVILAIGALGWRQVREVRDNFRIWRDLQACLKSGVRSDRVVFSSDGNIVQNLLCDQDYTASPTAPGSSAVMFDPQCLRRLAADSRGIAIAGWRPSVFNMNGPGSAGPWEPEPCIVFCDGVQASDGTSFLLVVGLSHTSHGGVALRWLTIQSLSPLVPPVVRSGVCWTWYRDVILDYPKLKLGRIAVDDPNTIHLVLPWHDVSDTPALQGSINVIGFVLPDGQARFTDEAGTHK